MAELETSTGEPSSSGTCTEAKPRPCHRHKEGASGYECKFVKPPPDVFQTECPVCLLILREPCLVSCCGNKFCRVCIERSASDQNPCPLCGKADFTFMRDHGLERSLLELEVWCSYEKEGCGWRGKLRELEVHLDRSLENRASWCQFAEMECGNKCGEWFHLCDVAIHESKQCKKRPYSCDHCRDYDSTFEDVIETHHPQCSKYPVVCPNACREYPFERRELETHLQDHCLLALIDCPFNYAGCKTQLLRKDMPNHLEETVTHLTMLATVTRNLVKANCEARRSLKEKDLKLQAVEQKFQTLKEVSDELKLNVTQHLETLGIPLIFSVKWSPDIVFSPAFYTHPHGYRMCVRVHPQGSQCGADTHVSVYLFLMPGLFDDQLKWPFRGKIVIQIVNQADNYDHVTEAIFYEDFSQLGIGGRVIGRKMSLSGNGTHKFISHKVLKKSTSDVQYLQQDNHFTVRIVRVCVF